MISIIAKKGSKPHKKNGIVFYYVMLIFAIIAMIVAFLPNHQSPFLFAVGIFSLYFVLTGKCALRFKQENPNLKTDKWISRVMTASAILMIILPIILTKSVNIILFVFAVVGIKFSIRDLILYKNPERLKDGWLRLHLGKVTRGYISATTAFVVVNEFFPSIYSWFVSGIIGGFFITYRLIKPGRQKTIANNVYKK